MSVKAGITCDDYKIDKFKKDLAAAGFTDVTVKAFLPEEKTSYIFVVTTAERIGELRNLCTLVELHFKRGN